jgi:pyruvate ferredoxin oxidoreductase alpha subunit
MTVRLTTWMPIAELPAGSSGEPAPPRQAGRGEVAALTGNEAAALAFRQADPHITAAYPIAPQTELMHRYAEYVAAGEVRTEMLTVESEHSAMSAVLAAAAAGCRTFTATSAVGLLHMMEAYQNAGALRLPVVLSLVNRHAGGLLNMHNDHGDAMMARNAPWIQMHAETAQETYDNILQAFRIAEDERVRLPVTVCHDGFIVSHTMERLLALPDEEARAFVGEFVAPVDLLDVQHPQAVGPLVLADFAPRLYAQIAESMRWAGSVIEEIGEEYGRLTQRRYGLFESYRLDDAEVAVLAMGSVCGTVRATVDLLRARGVRAGMVKLRVFRPFPADALARALQSPGLQALAVIDKCPDLGSGGPLFTEAAAALAVHSRSSGARLPVLCDVVLGIGGRDVTTADINGVFRRLLDLAADGVQPAGDPVVFLHPPQDAARTVLTPALPRRHAGENGSGRKVIFLARGGQGARTSSYLLAQMAIEAGRHAQAFPAHGPERSGAPVKAFAKLSPRPIDDRQAVYAPDLVVVFDEHLLGEFGEDLAHLADDGALVVNTPRPPGDIRRQLGLEGRRVYTIDATQIAIAEFGADRPNMVMLAATMRLLGMDQLESLKRVFRRKMRRLSDKTVQGNFRAMDRAGAELQGE